MIRILLAAAGIGAVFVGIVAFPSIARYLKIRSM